MIRALPFSTLLLGLFLSFGCTDQTGKAPAPGTSQPAGTVPHAPQTGPVSQVGGASPTAGEEAAIEDQRDVRELLEALLKAKNPGYNGGVQFEMQDGLPVGISLAGQPVSDISMFEKLPLMMLDLQGTQVADISALKGMPLRVVFLEDSKVEDISALSGAPIMQMALNNTRVRHIDSLRGAPIRELRMADTRVQDISALEGMPLEQLWLNDSDVDNIAPLKGAPLVSLTLRGTRVKDLSPLSGSQTLQRLHIAETRVEDLSPLAGLQLTRLVFTPSRIDRGIEVARAIPTMKEMGDSLEGMVHPLQFWERYDAGGFR